MKVDHALILAAGRGTRMGEIGQYMPKVIWPVFEKSILELEILFAKKLGATEIHTNLYYHKEKVLQHVVNNPVFDDVNLIEELSAIDIGGAIHNLATQIGYNGTLLILNSDQFIMLNSQTFEFAQTMLNDCDMVLFTYDVNSNQLYNKLDIDENHKLLGITLNQQIDRNIQHETYTGMALIKLESLEPSSGASKFFTTVANPKLNKVKCMNVSDAEYWDFGTITRYHDTMFDLLSKLGSDDAFVQFLWEHNAINKSKLMGNSYFTESRNAINLSDKKVKIGDRSILIKGENEKAEQFNNAILYKDIIQKLS